MASVPNATVILILILNLALSKAKQTNQSGSEHCNSFAKNRDRLTFPRSAVRCAMCDVRCAMFVCFRFWSYSIFVVACRNLRLLWVKLLT